MPPFIARGTIKKRDAPNQNVFGLASASSIAGELITDKHFDQIPDHELENAAYDFVLSSRRGNVLHKRGGHVSSLIESMFITPEKLEVIGITKSMAEMIPQAWWVGFHVDDPITWDLVEKRILTEFSIGGTGYRSLID